MATLESRRFKKKFFLSEFQNSYPLYLSNIFDARCHYFRFVFFVTFSHFLLTVSGIYPDPA